MHFPDVPTLLFLVGLLYLILATFTAMVLREQDGPAVRMWCAGGVLTGLSVLLVSAKGGAPDALENSAAAFLFTLAYCLRIQALRLDLGTAWRSHSMALLWAALFFPVLFISLEHPPLGTLFSNALAVPLALHIGRTAWQLARSENSDSARWLVAAYGLLGLAFFTRFVGLATSVLLDTPLVPVQPATVLLAYCGIVSAVVGHFGYVGLALERSQRRSLRARDREVRQEVARSLNARIAQLDRQRSLDEMSASLAREIAFPLETIAQKTRQAQQQLAGPAADAAALEEHMSHVVRYTRQAVETIQRIRDFIRPEFGDSVVVDLNAATLAAHDLVANEARDQGITIGLALSRQPVWMQCSLTEVTQIALNLLRNAMAAVPASDTRRIAVSTVADLGRAVLRVEHAEPATTMHALQPGTATLPADTAKAHQRAMNLVIMRTLAQQYGGRLTLHQANGDQAGNAVAEVSFPSCAEPAAQVAWAGA